LKLGNTERETTFLFEAVDVLRVDPEQFAPVVESSKDVVKWRRFCSIRKLGEAGDHLVKERCGVLGLKARRKASQARLNDKNHEFRWQRWFNQSNLA
jgi:hypothetical protein